MPRIWGAGLAVCLLAIGLNPARADDPAQGVIDKAIKAVGGAEQLGKMNATMWKAKGLFYGFGPDGIPFTADFAFQRPDKFKSHIDSDFNGQKFEFTTVVNGDHAWRRMGTDTT